MIFNDYGYCRYSYNNLYLYDDIRISENAKKFIEATCEQGNQIGISTITLVEIVYLMEKGRIGNRAFSKINDELQYNQSKSGEW